MKYCQHIDGLRALAVLSVFFMHLGIPGFSGGFIGVDVFFVISGFLITRIITDELALTRKFDFIYFYCRRALRILPALFFTLLFVFLTAIIVLNLMPFLLFGRAFLSAIFSVSNFYFYHKAGYFDVHSQSNPLLHTWSLGVEEQFYLLWPISLFLVAYFFPSRRRFFSLLLISVIFLVSLLLNWIKQYHGADLSRVYYLPQFRAFEFCIGAFLVYLVSSVDRMPNLIHEIFCFVGLLIIAYTLTHFNNQTAFPGVNALLPTIATALLIYSGSAKGIGIFFRNYPVRYIGLISYSLYLIHWPLIVLYKAILENLGYKTSLSVWPIIFILSTAFLFSALMYHFIEQPFRFSQSKIRNKKNKIFSYSVFTVAVLASFAFSTQNFSIWKWRLYPDTPYVKDMEKYNSNYWGGSDFDGGFIYKGKANNPKIILFGDSHSGMLDYGLWIISSNC